MPGIKGGLVFVGVNGIPRTQFDTDTNNWAPRFGLSWQFLPRTVLRIGYAHVYGPSQQAAAGTIGTMGYRVDNTWVASIDGVTPNDLLRNPYPRGVAPVRPRGSPARRSSPTFTSTAARFPLTVK